MMNELNVEVKELIEYATQEEMELYDKVSRISEKRAQFEFGKSRDVILGTFIIVWMERKDEQK